MSQAGQFIPGGSGSLVTSVVGGDNINVQTVGTVATVNLDTAISWPATDSTQGQILLDGVVNFHAFGTDNIFVGPGAGNFTLTGVENSGYGWGVLANLSSGNQNVAVGASAMSLGAVTGFGNVACGVGALASLESGIQNCCAGGLSGSNIDVGDNNSCYGYASGGGLTSGVENCFYGGGSGSSVGTNVQQNCGYGNGSLGVTSGNRNSAYGHRSMNQNVSGDNNCAFGAEAYANNSATGEYNVCIGVESGTNYTGSESSNIIIGNNLGVLGDSNTIRIGAPGSSTGQQDTCYIAGISGTTIGSTNSVVVVDSVGQLGVTDNVVLNAPTSGTALTVLSTDSTSTSGTIIARGQNNGNIPARLWLQKDRAGGVITTGDILGNIRFYGFDGTNYTSGASITSTSSGTIGADRVAANLVFATHPDSAASAPTSRMTIAPAGNVTINMPDSGNALSLGGALVVNAGGATITGTALTNQVAANADTGGTGGATTLTNGTVAASTGVNTLNATTATGGKTNAGYIKMYLGTNPIFIPYFTDPS